MQGLKEVATYDSRQDEDKRLVSTGQLGAPKERRRLPLPLRPFHLLHGTFLGFSIHFGAYLVFKDPFGFLMLHF